MWPSDICHLPRWTSRDNWTWYIWVSHWSISSWSSCCLHGRFFWTVQRGSKPLGKNFWRRASKNLWEASLWLNFLNSPMELLILYKLVLWISMWNFDSRYTWKIYSERLMTLAGVYGFWKYVSKLERRETRRYLEMFYILKYRDLVSAPLSFPLNCSNFFTLEF